MPRQVDTRKTAKALRKLRKLRDVAAQTEPETGADAATPDRQLSEWEAEFLDSVETRLETHGSAFADPEKGALNEPLSALQAQKLKEIDRKTRGKGPKSLAHGAAPRRSSHGLKCKSWSRKRPPPRGAELEIVEDVIDVAPETPRPIAPTRRPRLRVLDGGRASEPDEETR